MNNRFVFIAPMYNASKTLARMLHSLAGQSYENWHLVLIDDVSDAEHKQKYIEILKQFNCYEHKIITVWNDKKKWETVNVLNGIKQCNDDDIICRIDADDYLCDLDALYQFNACYEQTGCDCAWSKHRWDMSDFNISAPLKEGISVYVQPWVTSHLKTFRKQLLTNIPWENFSNHNGDPVKRCGDQALYLPVLHQSRKNVFIPRVMYHYTIDVKPETFQTDDAKFQKMEADFIRKRGYVANGDPWENFV